jgi:hypothetical protein
MITDSKSNQLASLTPPHFPIFSKFFPASVFLLAKIHQTTADHPTHPFF